VQYLINLIKKLLLIHLYFSIIHNASYDWCYFPSIKQFITVLYLSFCPIFDFLKLKFVML